MTNSIQVNAEIVSVAAISIAHNRSTATLAPPKEPAKFSRIDFKRWRKKMSFNLTRLRRLRQASLNSFGMVLIMEYVGVTQKNYY